MVAGLCRIPFVLFIYLFVLYIDPLTVYLYKHDFDHQFLDDQLRGATVFVNDAASRWCM